MGTPTLAIDFGTSNSAAAVLLDGRLYRLPIEDGADTLPTAVFFDARGGGMKIGEAASEALIEGEDGRYMRALKSVLGTSLFHEEQPIGGRRQTLADVVTAFLEEVKARSELLTGERFDRVLSGRPVHFHTADPERDAQAEEDLRTCYEAAGFRDVEFMLEPEAAAVASHGLGRAGALGLIVDIGGGTSDFTVFKTEPDYVRILASHGVRLGGTDFDHAVSMVHAMPHLGLGSELRREFGPGLQPVPRAIYGDLATWAKIPFLYTQEVRREVAGMAKLAVERRKLDRLSEVLVEELGHQLAFAVERGKIAANSGVDAAQIDMDFVDEGLAVEISATSLDAALARYSRDLGAAASETLHLASVTPDEVETVVLVGGSSLMNLVKAEMTTLCPAAALEYSDAFTAVVDGLALATETL